MFKRILVPTDGSEFGNKAVAMAINLARTHGATLVALHVFPHLPGAQHSSAAPFLKQLEGDYEAGQREESKEILDAVASQAAAAGVAAETVVVEGEELNRQIIDTAEQRGCDLICMSSHARHGVAAVVFGDEAHKVLMHSHIPVLVVR
jgi:nucleotide-binding universal stress UspA family protein